MRPIISSIGSYNYPLSKYLASKIAQCKQPTSSYIKDSFEFVTTILKIKPDKQSKICSFDVESLYTNVPVNETIEMTLDLMYKPKKITDLPFDRTTAKKLLELAVSSIPFRFLDENYVQVDGVAIGLTISSDSG